MESFEDGNAPDRSSKITSLQTFATQSINTSLLTIGVGPGFTIYSSNGLALEALVKYNFANSNSKIDVQGIQRTSKTWTNAIDFSVGVQYYFGGFRTVTVAK